MLNLKRQGRVALATVTGYIGDKASRSAKEVIRFGNALNAGSGRLDLYQPIDEFMGTGAKDFAKQLDALGDVDEIDCFINSPGGDVFDSISIHSMLSRHKARKNVHIDGLAASAASFIAMAGDTIDIVESGRVMIHNAMGIVLGDHREMRQVADVLESLSGTIANIYAKRTNRRPETFARLMDDETWFDAREAVANRLADSIVPLKGRPEQEVKARLAQLDADELRDRDPFSRYAIAARLREISLDK
jgi:ATP-dependent protease ClpP protease subunit